MVGTEVAFGVWKIGRMTEIYMKKKSGKTKRLEESDRRKIKAASIVICM